MHVYIVHKHQLSLVTAEMCMLFCCQLSYAMSMMGEPQVVLLDEPSTGMDPRSKRFLW